jgi:hypothetical protein
MVIQVVVALVEVLPVELVDSMIMSRDLLDMVVVRQPQVVQTKVDLVMVEMLRETAQTLLVPVVVVSMAVADVHLMPALVAVVLVIQIHRCFSLARMECRMALVQVMAMPELHGCLYYKEELLS